MKFFVMLVAVLISHQAIADSGIKLTCSNSAQSKSSHLGLMGYTILDSQPHKYVGQLANGNRKVNLLTVSGGESCVVESISSGRPMRLTCNNGVRETVRLAFLASSRVIGRDGKPVKEVSYDVSFLNMRGQLVDLSKIDYDNSACWFE